MKLMKIKRYAGNITLLALFVLLASALIGVLVTLFMKNFIRYSDDIASYEKANYAGKAWTELALAMIGSRGIGFSFTINSWNAIMDNFSCPFLVEGEEICPQKPNFSLGISGLALTKSNNPWISDSCEDEKNYLEVKPWFSVILPLFYDQGDESTIENNLKNNTRSALQSLNGLVMKGKWNWKFGITAFEGNQLSLFSWDGEADSIKEWNLFNGKESYLIIANPSLTTSSSLCITRNDGYLPQETVKIVSIGSFKNRQLGTETFATKKLPDFLQGDNYLISK